MYGVSILIDATGLSMLTGDVVAFSGMPEVVDGRFVMTGVGSGVDSGVEPEIDLLGMLAFSDEDFVDVVETGLNEAFAEHDLVPTAISVHDGVMIVRVTSAS